MVSKAFTQRGREACIGATSATPERTHAYPMCSNLAAFASTDQVENASHLCEIALSLVEEVMQAGRPVPSDDSRLEEATDLFYQAIFEIDGVLAVSLPCRSFEPKWRHNPVTTTTAATAAAAATDVRFASSTNKVPCHQQPEYDEGMRCFKELLLIGTETVDVMVLNHQLAATLIYNIGQVRLLQKHYDAAQSSFLDAYIMAEHSPGFPNSIALPILHNLGYIQYRNGDIDASLHTFTAALQICSQRGEKAHTAATLNCLGVLHFHMPNKADTKRSLEYLLRSLSIQKILSGTQTLLVATTLNNIGRVHYIDGNFDMALQAYHDALRLRRMLLGDDHLDVAATVFNLGQTYHHKDDLTLALQQYEEFMRIVLPHLGRCHRDVAFMLKCIAQIHHQWGDDMRALGVYKEALFSCQVALGVHPEVASVLNKLGNLYYGQGDYDSALTMYQQGLHVERAVFTEFHPNIAVTLANIAQIHKQRGDLTNAFRLYEEVYAIQIASVGGRDPSVAGTLANMALMHYQSRNHDSALELYQEALDIRREAFGDKNLEVASTLNSIGLVLFKLGMLPMALESFSQSLKIRQSLLGNTHRDIAVNLYNIATIQMELGNDDEAMRFYKETLRVEKHALGSEHIDVVPTLRHIAHAHQQRGEVHEALQSYLEVLRIQRRNLPDAYDLAIERTLKCIGNLHFLRGDAGGCVEALSDAFRIAKRHGRGMESIAELRLLGFHLYSFAKMHPEGAAAA